ncbi:hypothetical protein GCM10027044_28630 [Hymenobacter ruber]
MVKWLGTDPEEYPTAPRRILNWAAYIHLHYCDFFCYASSDTVKLEDTDFHWAVPFIEQWGTYGVEAVGCLLYGGPECLPIKPSQTPGFMEARAALLALSPKITSEQD